MNPLKKDKKGKEDLTAKNEEIVTNHDIEEPETLEAEEIESRECELTKQLEGAFVTIEEQNDKYLRLSAEFDNYRKRTMKEKAELIKNGGEKAITNFLPIIDDMERAIKMLEETLDLAAAKEGMILIYNKFINTLTQLGVIVIDSTGKDFNTDFHEAIALVPAPNEETKGKILDTVQTGYLLNDKVIRHAKVVVGE